MRVRAYNERLVMSLVRRHGSLSKADIARRSGLSAQTVTVIMRALEAEGLLIPFPSERTAVAPANPAVNRAGVEGPELLIPPEQPIFPPSDTLF